MAVKEGDTIKVSYTGFLEDGQIFDSTEKHDGKLLEFTVGENQIIPGFDEAVRGKEVNEEFKVQLSPKEAYGEYNDKAVQKVERTQLPENLDPEVGMMLEIEQKHGDHSHRVPVFITEVNSDTVTLDLNHPLAGKTLNFDIKIEEIVNRD